jgi:hypothetical protein
MILSFLDEATGQGIMAFVGVSWQLRGDQEFLAHIRNSGV